MNITLSNTDNKWAGGNKPDEIVIHHWDDPAKHPTMQGVIAHFQNPASQVSAHYVVSDDRVVQMVPESDRAWHALSANSHSIGIEIDPNFPGATYATVGELVRGIRSRWGNLPLIRHRDVPGVSTECPGDTNLDLIEQYARGEDMEPAPYWVARIIAQTVLLRDMDEDEWNKYHKNKTRDQLFDEFRSSDERAKKMQALFDAYNLVQKWQSTPTTGIPPEVQKQIDDAKQLVNAADLDIEKLKLVLKA